MGHGLATFLMAGLMAGLAAVAPIRALAGDGGKSICIREHEIDHTRVLKDHSLLFVMIDRRKYIVKPTSRCATLTPDRGFIFSNDIDEICSNLLTIRVTETGEVCPLGAFVPYQGKAD